MKYQCKFTAEYFEFDATDFYLEPDAVLDCSGRGATKKGPGSGADSALGGSGAGHATEGGDGATAKGGTTFGSLYEPVEVGARGGDGPHGVAGSRGGGRVRVKVGYAFVLDGVVKVDADNAALNSGKFSH